MQSKSIKVKIFGSEYPLRGENVEFTKAVAGYVDGMLSSIHDKVPQQPPLTVAVLTALNIAEDLMKEREGHSSTIHYAVSEMKKINEFLDQQIQHAQV